jgi:hypothetical protein
MPTEREKILVGFGQAFEHGRLNDRALFSVKRLQFKLPHFIYPVSFTLFMMITSSTHANVIHHPCIRI